jgi:hypothetical protein
MAYGYFIVKASRVPSVGLSLLYKRGRRFQFLEVALRIEKRKIKKKTLKNAESIQRISILVLVIGWPTLELVVRYSVNNVVKLGSISI